MLRQAHQRLAPRLSPALRSGIGSQRNYSTPDQDGTSQASHSLQSTSMTMERRAHTLSYTTALIVAGVACFVVSRRTACTWRQYYMFLEDFATEILWFGRRAAPQLRAAGRSERYGWRCACFPPPKTPSSSFSVSHEVWVVNLGEFMRSARPGSADAVPDGDDAGNVAHPACLLRQEGHGKAYAPFEIAATL